MGKKNKKKKKKKRKRKPHVDRSKTEKNELGGKEELETK